jgi:hypothetical protein
MRLLRICAVGTALLIMPGAGSVLADPSPVPPSTIVPAPNWSAGSEWHYSDGYALKVSSTGAGGTVFERIDAPGQWFSRLGFIRKDSLTAGTTRNSIYRTIPDNAGLSLSAAKSLTFQREYMSNGKLLVHASSWTVEGRETITVPAGTFDCWLIVWRTRSLRSDWTGFERWWYSPQTQNYVRLEYKYGAEKSGSRVLMRYKLGSALIPSATPETVPPARGTVQKETLPQNDTQIRAALPQPKAEMAEMPKPAAPARSKPIAVSRQGPWHVQLAASQQETSLRDGLRKILQKNASWKSLPNGVHVHEVAEKGRFYRAWLGAYDNAQDAKTLCKSVKAAGTECFVFKKEDSLEGKQLAQGRG